MVKGALRAGHVRRLHELPGPVGHSPPELGGAAVEFLMISRLISRIPP